MSWKKASTPLADSLAEQLVTTGCVRSTMFGCPVFTLHGRIVAGVFGDSVFLHLSPSGCAAIRAANDEVAPFEPIAGRPMREYVVIPDSMCERGEVFTHWLEQALEYAAWLPPKEPKAPAQRKATARPKTGTSPSS
jgi:hypothetical protein